MGAARLLVGATSTSFTAALVIGSLILVPYLILAVSIDELELGSFQPAGERTLVLLAADGQPFAKRGGCVAERVTLDEVPSQFVDALLSMEDRRFFGHLGIDPIGIARAAWRNHKAGRIVQGGSTITQQLVKFSLLSSDRTMQRKRKEAWLALALELRLDKNQILERYISAAYFGGGCYGLRAAAKHHFGAAVERLSLPQSAYLVGLLRSPSTLAANEEAAAYRAERVLDAMVRDGKLSAEDRANLSPAQPHISDASGIGGHYADWIASSLRVPQTGDYSPLPIHTTFQPQLQILAEQAVREILGEKGKRRDAGQAAMVVMRTDGRVLAMVGGRDYQDSQFNRAVQAKRQPGSAFKLFVYLAALRGGLKIDSTIVDEPITIGHYKPQNFNRRYRGAVTAQRAFASSINVVAVRLSEGVGRQPVVQAARDLGIATPLDTQPSLALGAFEVTPLQLTAAYAAAAAGAYPVKPWAITGFSDADNTLPPKDAGEYRLTYSKDLLSLLRATVETGTGRGARLPLPAYGKTGTSQDYRDAWFIGFAGNLVAGVWVGNDDFSPMKRVTGGSLPAEIWVNFMRDALEEDEGFENQLPQISAFPAAAREGVRAVTLALGVANAATVEVTGETKMRSDSTRRRKRTIKPSEGLDQNAPRSKNPDQPRQYGGFARGMFQ